MPYGPRDAERAEEAEAAEKRPISKDTMTTTMTTALAPPQRRRGGEGVLGQLRFLQCDHVTSGQDSFCVVITLSKLAIFYTDCLPSVFLWLS